MRGIAAEYATLLRIKPTVDIVFKKLLGSPEHLNLTLSFLNAVLPLAGRPLASSVEILNPWRLADFSGERDIVVDVRARDESGRDFQIEMQVRPDPAPFERMLDTWARIYVGQLRKGEPFSQHRPTISIWILGHSLFPDPAWSHPLEILDRSSGQHVAEDFCILVIELEKRALLPDFGERIIMESGIDEWLYLLARGDALDPE